MIMREMNRFPGAMVVLAAALACGAAEEPKLVVGVVSDVHMSLERRGELFERRFRDALRYFDSRKVDAVLGCGDWVELGWYEWFRSVGEIWFEVFPDNRRSDGAHVEKLFIYGDHEIENFYNPNITRRYSHDYIAARDIPTYGRAKLWEETFREPWAPIQRKTVKGYDFVLAHFTMREGPDGDQVRWGEYIPGLAEFFATNAFSKTKPFFYAQHKPPKNTVISPRVGSQTDGSTVRVLSAYPNCFAFCGAKHKSAVSERNLWRGAFTCFEVPALQVVQTDAGHENGWASCDGYSKGRRDPPAQMPRITTGADGGQFLVVEVFEDRLVVERWNADFREKVAKDWVLPLAAGLAEPVYGDPDPTVRARVPAFPEKAAVSVVRRIGPDALGTNMPQYVVSFPRAPSSETAARAYDYRVTATVTKHFWPRVSCEKWVYSDTCYLPESRETNRVCCVFSQAEVPGPFDSVTFTVTPYSAFGVPGAPIVSAPAKF